MSTHKLLPYVLYCNGTFAHELQIGPLVFMYYHQCGRRQGESRISVWRDRFWRS